jgi:hypothetical protein
MPGDPVTAFGSWVHVSHLGLRPTVLLPSSARLTLDPDPRDN